MIIQHFSDSSSVATVITMRARCACVNCVCVCVCVCVGGAQGGLQSLTPGAAEEEAATEGGHSRDSQEESLH